MICDLHFPFIVPYNFQVEYLHNHRIFRNDTCCILSRMSNLYKLYNMQQIHSLEVHENMTASLSLNHWARYQVLPFTQYSHIFHMQYLNKSPIDFDAACSRL